MSLDDREVRFVPAAVRRKVDRERPRSGNVPVINERKDRSHAGKARIRARKTARR